MEWRDMAIDLGFFLAMIYNLAKLGLIYKWRWDLSQQDKKKEPIHA
jgi:hypothetical protein